jgi:hypothetical protein
LRFRVSVRNFLTRIFTGGSLLVEGYGTFEDLWIFQRCSIEAGYHQDHNLVNLFGATDGQPSRCDAICHEIENQILKRLHLYARRLGVEEIDARVAVGVVAKLASLLSRGF